MKSSSRNSTTSSKHPPLINSVDQFRALCDRLAKADAVAFDTEFLSEATYRPQLCLLQFATEDEVVAVDPLAIRDLSPWWQLMADPDLLVIVHGGREEIRFCLREGNCIPRNLVDVQIAEGLLSRGFPLGYSHLVQRVLGDRVHGKHTRTDWSRRPLSDHQVKYALDDVEYLPAVWKQQKKSLTKQGRLEWAVTECDRFVAQLAEDPPRGDWRRINGSLRLSRREMGVLRELHDWRDREAEARDRPPRFIFRDDLLIEVAKIQPTTAEELHHVRGLERNNFRRHTDAILAAVAQGQTIPDDDLPEKPKANRSLPDTEALSKLLSIALANRCAELSVSTSLVGTTSDLHDLIRWHVHQHDDGAPPKLMQGWREEVCGDLLADLMDGKVTLRVTDPTSDHPLVFEPFRE